MPTAMNTSEHPTLTRTDHQVLVLHVDGAMAPASMLISTPPGDHLAIVSRVDPKIDTLPKPPGQTTGCTAAAPSHSRCRSFISPTMAWPMPRNSAAPRIETA